MKGKYFRGHFLPQYGPNDPRLVGVRIYPDKEGFMLWAHPGQYGKTKDGIWMCWPPSDVVGVVSFANHEVVEHEDGTITVSPSILITAEGQWHGYLEKGIWREV